MRRAKAEGSPTPMELIERDQQLRLLGDTWGQVKSGKGRLALVSGEAGIGKTSLVERFVAEHGRSAQVLWGACDALFSPQPLGPFLEIALQIQSDRVQAAQARSERLAFSREFFTYLQKGAVPTIVVLEDLHWADEATLDVVKFLGRRIQHTRSLLLLTYRDDEASGRHPLAQLVGDFPTHLTTRLALPLLSPEAVEQLVRQQGLQLEGLYKITGGNPFFVTEIIGCGSEGVPPSVRDAVLARVGRLSAPAQAIVELAALMPGAAEAWLIQDILHPAPDALDECEQRGILRAKDGALAFRHELARQSVEDSLSIGRTRDLHAKLLAALLRREGEPVPLARLVHHATRAGDEAATLRFAPEAARQASALGAHREAASLYSAALRYLHRLEPLEQADLLEQFSFQHYLIDNLEPALRACEQAIRIWQVLDHPECVGNAQRWLSRLYWTAGDKQAAERHADLAVESLSALPPSRELAMAYSNKSQLHMLAWEIQPAIEWGQRAIALAEQLGAVEILVHALTNVGSAGFIESHEGGQALIERALRMAREHDMDEHAGRCYSNLASSCVQLKRFEAAQRWLDEGLEYTTARDVDIHSVYLRGWRAQLYLETGRWAEAELHALEALRLAPASLTINRVPALIALGHLKMRQGDPAAGEYLEQAQALALPTGELQRLGPLAAARAEAAWQRGELAQVVAAAADAYALALRRTNPWILGQLGYWLWRADERDLPLERLPEPYAALVRGDWRRAAELWAALGCPYEQALALAEGDRPEQLEALRRFEQLGARPAAERLRARLQAGRTRPLKLAAPAGLTPRELEVLRLVAAGLSNPVLAEKLTISVGTVKAHTANIYSKLGVNNRVLAIARAKELNLL